MKILVYPKGENPYQELLYNNSNLKNLIEYLDLPSNLFQAFLVFKKIIKYRLLGYSIFHLHWTYPFVIVKSNWQNLNWFSKLLNSGYFFSFILFLKLLNFKIVWTVHNIQPHEEEFLNDIQLMRFLSLFSNAKIVHSESTLNEMKGKKISIKNSFIIPIGHYIDVYKNTSSNNESREKLNLKNDTFIFLFFGLIREYKGIENLLTTYKEFIKRNVNSILFIVGESKSTKLELMIKNITNVYPKNIRFISKYVKDDEVQYYFNASNIVVLPFNKLTTSSTAILSMSFAKPIIYPKIGNLLELPDKVGISFKTNSVESLKNALDKAIKDSDKLDEMGKEGFAYIKNFTWSKIAADTYKVYKFVLKI